MGGDGAERVARLRASYEDSGVFLFEETYGRLVRVALGRGVARDVADDLAQEALATLFERRPVVRNPEHWLLRILLRRICDLWRDRELVRRAFDRMADPAAPPSPPDPIRRRRLRSALAALPRKSRLLIRSRYLEGRDEASAASAAGYAPASFKKAMTRALARLRAELRATGGPASARDRS
jgi:RNA polymerase sigma factor (sigma-70 family)